MTSVTTIATPTALNTWDTESLLTSGDAIFESMLEGIYAAQKSILFETYIYKNDALGQRLASALIHAARRKVKVRIIVDGIGSPGWIFTIGAKLKEEGVEVKVYHQLPWERLIAPNNLQNTKTFGSILQAFNRRDHRKMCIVDNTTAWVSSMNIWTQSVAAMCGDEAWREMGIKIEGQGIKYLVAAFDLVWYPWFHRYKKFLRYTKRIVFNSKDSLLRLNSTKKLRLYQRNALLTLIQNASTRIYIANAYFVPHAGVVAALRIAAKRGVDVRIVTSTQSDIFFMPWIAATFQASLLKAGVKIYWYQPCFLHAKYIIIDQWAAVGSSNFNQRSFHHDLEVDVVSITPSTVHHLTQQFKEDLARSHFMRKEDFANRPWWQKLFGRLVLFFKYFL